MIIDAHCYVGKSIYGDKQTPHELIKNMDSYQIDKAIIIPFTPEDLDFKRQNDYIAEVVSRSPERFIGFGRVDPRLKGKAVQELNRIVKDLKLRGLMLHPMEQAFKVNDELVRPVFKECSDLNIPVLIAAGYPLISTPLQIGDLAGIFPDLIIIMTHAGQTDSSGLVQFDAITVMSEYKNIFAETSGIHITGKDGFINSVVGTVGAERVIFGSASPLMHQNVELTRVKVAMITEEEKRQILGKNIAKILKLP
jgi:hypothetical protein